MTVLLVSVDDMDEGSRATITRLLREKSMTVPALIDHRHQLIDRLAPRDRNGEPYHVLSMLVVIDRRFRLRLALDLAHLVDDAAPTEFRTSRGSSGHLYRLVAPRWAAGARMARASMRSRFFGYAA